MLKTLSTHIHTFRDALQTLGDRGGSLNKHVMAAVKTRLATNGLVLLTTIVCLILFSADIGTYGLGMVGVGAVVIAWTAFRIHADSFYEAAGLQRPGRDEEGTPNRRRLTVAAKNYTDAAFAVSVIILGYIVRVAASLG